ncbi:FecCD family ABC transporter permease [Falsibacillus pallidus]|uniref:Iron complex transport system permease protein n=1 Tax=Falsibacillus pallidus TaxID=493781 RepID=A0A370FZY1_9BACI|nr:iron ABC transporter permease [Falsibacillus pallidus]RDI37217.1 iron complex transport system permease protein [Falsibacillus pallidus]
MIHPSIIKKQRLLLALFTLLIFITVFIGMGLGYSSVSYKNILPTIFGEGTFKDEFVLFSIRMPRIIITLLSGMALAVSGAILQRITRNDLADPGIIGINSGAGAAIALFFLYAPIEADSFAMLIPVVAFLGAFAAALLIYLFSFRKNEGLQPTRLILTGIGLSMALSGLMIVLISSAEREKVDFIAKWLAGAIWGSDWPFIWAILPWLAALIPFTFYKAQRLNLFGVSAPVSIGVGMSMEKERFTLLLTAVGLSAAAVSITGGIAFIGLMAPHLAKALIGPRHQLFLPLATLIGGWLLILADTIGRNIAGPEGIPAGIVAALIGAPYFIYLLVRK